MILNQWSWIVGINDQRDYPSMIIIWSQVIHKLNLLFAGLFAFWCRLRLRCRLLSSDLVNFNTKAWSWKWLIPYFCGYFGRFYWLNDIGLLFLLRYWYIARVRKHDQGDLHAGSGVSILLYNCKYTLLCRCMHWYIWHLP